MVYPSREDYDPYFYDPEGEKEAYARRQAKYEYDESNYEYHREKQEQTNED